MSDPVLVVGRIGDRPSVALSLHNLDLHPAVRAHSATLLSAPVVWRPLMIEASRRMSVFSPVGSTSLARKVTPLFRASISREVYNGLESTG